MSKNTKKSPQGIALEVSNRGILNRVIHDTFGLFPEKPSASTTFADCLETDSIAKGYKLIDSVNKNGVAYGWELHICDEGSSTLFNFSGVKMDDMNLIIGIPDPEDREQFLNGLMEMNNEQINKLRSLMKNKRAVPQSSEEEWNLYDEMSGLNNELANMQRKLTKKTAELERTNELKNQMLGMAAHDLRNPLNLIQNYAVFLLEDHHETPFLSEEQEQLVKEIKASSKHMVNIIEDMLDISTFESGSLSLEMEEHDLIQLIERVVTLNGSAAAKKNIKISLELPESSVVKEIDYHKFQQVLDNLLSNAIKFSHSDTEVRVGIQKASKSDKVTIVVRDQGQGIPEDEIEKLFQPFSQLSAVPTGGEKSTGLGLAIADKIVRAHGGHIEVESEPGTGSTFCIELP
ncbi:Signal transduction histidine kinase [Fodinibius roseus]|uniref:histidine kinase n=1 Tax=Fodinibius roseus TaxID=1194090 RepID=A0A1M5HYW6_9BACT|nr:HAMP domain-containing sensor histidine kinase [Fodinibius roseus]SHG21224.1 Signal transduction histidine kinase [Fodinibius roseus]